MNRSLLNAFLSLTLLVLLALNWWLPADMARPNYQFIPDMVRSIPFDAFAANPNFPDGKTLRQPPSHTIPQGFPPLRYQPNPEDAARAGEQLSNPMAQGDTVATRRGETVYVAFCSVCHGAGGSGDGVVVQRGYPAPPSLLAAKALNIKDGQIFHILTYGQGNMPSYASQISREDRWKAILYVRRLQAAAPPPLATTQEGQSK